MARKNRNQVTLTFAGDASQLQRSFDKVGQSAKEMSGEVGQASQEMRSAGSGFDRAGTAADSAEERTQGFASTLTGTKDAAMGLGMVLKGNTFEGLVMVGQGAADLSEGLAKTVIPAMRTLITRAPKATAAMVTSAARQIVAWTLLGVRSLAAAAKVALAWLIAIGPIALVIAAVVGLVALIVANWDKVKKITMAVFNAVWGFLKNIWNNITGFIGNAIDTVGRILGGFDPLRIIRSIWNSVLDFFQGIPGKIGDALSTVADAIGAPFRAAFDGIRSLWNSTVAGFGFSIPDWVPFVGGNRFEIPRMHQGGIVPGLPGQETLAVLQAGERVTPAGASGGRTVIEIRSGGSTLDDALVEILARAVRIRGGDAQLVLGGA